MGKSTPDNSQTGNAGDSLQSSFDRVVSDLLDAMRGMREDLKNEDANIKKHEDTIRSLREQIDELDNLLSKEVKTRTGNNNNNNNNGQKQGTNQERNDKPPPQS
jgi:hypothetical protein